VPISINLSQVWNDYDVKAEKYPVVLVQSVVTADTDIYKVDMDAIE